MQKSLTNIVLVITLQVSFCGYNHAQEKAINSPVYDSTLLQAGRLNSALSGLTEFNFSEFRNVLMTLQPEISHYPKEQQAQYWYYLAISGWKLSLPSDQVIPQLDKALLLSDAVEDYELFKILMQAKDIARDYQYFYKVISYIDGIKQLVGQHPDPQSTPIVSPIDAQYAIAHHKIGEHKKAIGYLNNLISRSEVAGDKPVRYWFQVLSSAQVANGDIAGALDTLKKLLAYYPHSNTIQYLEWLETTLAEKNA